MQHQTGHEQTGAPEFAGGNAVTGSFATWIREIVAGDAASDGHGGLDGEVAFTEIDTTFAHGSLGGRGGETTCYYRVAGGKPFTVPNSGEKGRHLVRSKNSQGRLEVER